MWRTIKAVLWGFLGIRSSKGYDEDRQKLNVKHVIIAGIICALIFVFTLVMLVKIITSK
jgi:Protein of unknown function (DUF2970)